MRVAFIQCLGATVLVLCFATTSFAQRASVSAMKDGRGIFKYLALRQGELRVVLAQVSDTVSLPAPQSGNLSWIAHELIVLSEHRRLIPEGSRIRIVNNMSGIGGGTGPGSLPSGWGPGTIFLMVVTTTADEGTFEWAGRAQLIGVELPCNVKPEDVPEIKVALMKLGEVAARADGMLSREEDLSLLDVRDNYYLWAIGAAGLAALNDKGAVDELYKRWRSTPMPKPRQIAWLDYCFQHYISEDLRPSTSDRNQMLLQYLQRLDPISPPTTAPSGFGT